MVPTHPIVADQAGKSNPLYAIRREALRHVESLLGTYRGFDADAIAEVIGGFDESACRWVTGADAEELRREFFPRAAGDRPGAWQSVDVMCPTHGRDLHHGYQAPQIRRSAEASSPLGATRAPCAYLPDHLGHVHQDQPRVFDHVRIHDRTFNTGSSERLRLDIPATG